MLERGREQDDERQEERARPQQPAPALQFGTLGWASAVGNQAVARLARETAEEELAPEAEVEEAPAAEVEPPLEEPALGEETALGEEPAAEAEAESIPDDLPDELPK